MLSPAEIRLGIVVADARTKTLYRNVNYMPLLESLDKYGCLESNIQVKLVPSDFDIPLGVLFFAEYTDVDGVIVVGNSYDATIAKALFDLQIQWNMPVEYDYAESTADGRNVIQMVQIQSQMAAEVPEEQRIPVANRRENIN